MLKEPYYGFFLIMLNKVWRKDVPTACVYKSGINFSLGIGPEFWDKLSEEHRLGLLKHELLHIAFQHLTAFGMFNDKRMANIAMDMEINQYINKDWLPKGGIDIDDYKDMNLNRKAGSRYYYDQLHEAKKKKEQDGSSGCENMDKLLDSVDGNGGTFSITDGNGNGKEVEIPDHKWEDFENMPEAEKKLIEKQLQKVLQDAKEQTLKKRGIIPGEIESNIKIEEVIPPKFDWKGFIRRFTGVSTRVFTKKIRRKENRRFESNPGLKVKMRQHMLLGIDTSASVNERELKEFMNEIHHIYRCGVDITIIQCDTRIKDISEYKGERDLDIHGRGGTEFDPVLEYFNANLRKYTSLVYFTDGECYTDIKPRGHVLWVLSEESHLNDSLPGKVIKLEI